MKDGTLLVKFLCKSGFWHSHFSLSFWTIPCELLSHMVWQLCIDCCFFLFCVLTPHANWWWMMNFNIHVLQPNERLSPWLDYQTQSGLLSEKVRQCYCCHIYSWAVGLGAELGEQILQKNDLGSFANMMRKICKAFMERANSGHIDMSGNQCLLTAWMNAEHKL